MMITSNENMFVCFLVVLAFIPIHLWVTLHTMILIYLTYFHGIFQKIDDAGPQQFTPKKYYNSFWILFCIVLALLMEFNGISMNIFDFTDKEGQSFKISKIISEVTT